MLFFVNSPSRRINHLLLEGARSSHDEKFYISLKKNIKYSEKNNKI